MIHLENGCLCFMSQDENISLQLLILLQDEFAFGLAWGERESVDVTCPQRWRGDIGMDQCLDGSCTKCSNIEAEISL